jgi:K+/H+ antiporter YhaU regulatory subunit KhtT
MPKKIQDCTKAHLISIDLPVHGDSYTVISHESVMDYAYTELANAGFGIVQEEYRATADGQIAQGIYRLNYNSDPELSMMFAWTNSYNKQVRFKCGVGAYVNQTGTVMVCGDMGSWARKHTGTADAETIQTIKEQIAHAQMYYKQLVSDKEAMKVISMNKRRQAQMLGILFAEYQILTTEQASMIRNQMDRPSHVFEDSNSLWAFYNYVTIALQHSHPKTWMEDQRVLHYFISSVNNFSTAPVPQPVVEASVDPLTTNYGEPDNQLNILTEIEKTEAEETSLETESSISNLDLNEFKIENNLNDSNVEEIANEPIEETITYTDPAGNTFETPIFNSEVEEAKTLDVEFMTLSAEEDDFEDFQEDVHEDWLTVDPNVKSLQPTPEDHVQFEADLSKLEVEVEEEDDDFDLLNDIEDQEYGDVADFF